MRKTTPKSPFEVANHRRRRLGERQRVYKFGSQHTGHDAGATVAQARLTLKHVRHPAHCFEHARHRRSRAPEQRCRVAEVLELLVVVVLLDRPPHT